MGRDDVRSRSVLGLLLLSVFTVITLDARQDSASAVDPLRDAAGAVFGPMEDAADAAVEPIGALVDRFGDVDELRAENARLRRNAAELRTRLRASAVEQGRRNQLARMLGRAEAGRYRVVPAQVIAIGSAQTFSNTVTIDAGRRDGVGHDMTLVNDSGLVGRVVRADAWTATAVLLPDPESVVGGRLGNSSELGFVRGLGEEGESGRLQLTLVDAKADAEVGEQVLTWGSRGGAPYVPGIPIGRVESVTSTPSSLSTTAIVRPYVDFTALDVVGVVSGPPRGERQPAPTRAVDRVS